MAIDLLLNCRKAPAKSEIEEVIIPLGFRIEKEWSDDKHPLYSWFEERDLASLRGCSLRWYKPDTAEAPCGTETVFVATTYAGRSYEDLDMQNRVIRELKSRFGGSVYDPERGRYSYLPNDIPKLSYAEKRCGLVYSKMKEIMWRIKGLPCEIPSVKIPVFLKEYDVLIIHENIIRNNLLLPFLVSCLETFLRNFFVAFVESQPGMLERIYERHGKVEYAVLRDLLEGKISLAEHEANNFSFQNLESANAAFQQYVGVNLFSAWSQRKKFNARSYRVIEVLQELLSIRHRIIHEAYVKSDLGQNEVSRYIKFVEYAVDLLVQRLEKEKGYRIDLEKYI